MGLGGRRNMEFKASLSYTESLCLKNKETKKERGKKEGKGV